MDTKPKILGICSGGWDASSPITYTLQRNSKYAHFGYTKNIGYLAALFSDIEYQKKKYDEHKEDFSRILEGTWENYAYNFGHRLNHTEDLEPLKDFPIEHFRQLISLPYTYDKFIQFNLALYNHIKQKGYKSVGTYFVFGKIETGCLNFEFYNLLKNFFDIKCIFLVRDPIRSAISRAAFFKTSDKHFSNLDISIFDNYVDDYVKYFDSVIKVVPDTHLVIMEELWGDNGEAKQKLSEFLDHPIDELWPNLYSPDIGHHLEWDLHKHYCPVPCQPVRQSNIIITTQLYNELKSRHLQVYDAWIKRFGTLPLHWGKPIDYDKNLEIYPYYDIKYKYPL